MSEARLPVPHLPRGWAWIPLGSLSALEKNALTDGPFGSKLKSEHYRPFGPRVVRLQNIGEGHFKDARAHISENHFASLQKHRIYGGDLAIAVLGEVLPKSCVIPDWLGPAIVKADCIRFKPNPELIAANYLNHAINFHDTRKQTSAIIHGVGRPRLNLFKLKSILIPVAPLNEQVRIAATLDQLFSDLDAGVAALERVRKKLKLYRASVLKAAVEGALTAEWRAQHPHNEPASELLERILAERRRRWEEDQLAKFKAKGQAPGKDWKEKYKEPVAPDTSILPMLPEGWCWARLGQLLFEIEAGKSFECLQRPAGSDEWGIIKVSAMSWGAFDEFQNKTVPSNRQIDSHYEIRCGDILLSRANTFELVGASVLVGQCRPRLLMSDKSMRLLHGRHVDKVWLKTVLGSPWVRRQLSRKSTGTKEGMRNVSQESVLDVVIPLAPTDECVALVEAVEDQLSVVEHLESDLDAKLRSAQALRQSILGEAFAGRLVPQDANDEAASELLKRIAAEREERAKQAKAVKQPTTKGVPRRAA